MSIIFKKNQLMFLLMVAMFMLALFQPNFAFAQEGDLNNSPISRGLCNVFELAGGNIGKAIAIFAIVAVGFGFFTGKFSIALVIGITLGIGILFGAPKIISALTGTNAVDCGTVTAGSSATCPGEITIVPGNNMLMSVPYSIADKSIKIMSGQDELAVMSCINWGGKKRLQMTMSINNYTQRALAPAVLLAGSTTYGVLSTTPLPASGSATITTADIPDGVTNATFTFANSTICPGVDVALTAKATCVAGSEVTIAAAGTTGPSSNKYGTTGNVMCAPVQQGLGTSTIVSYANNPSHQGLFAISAPATTGRLSIKPGFAGDVRQFSLGTGKIMRALCDSATGKWNITTTTGITNNSPMTTVTSTGTDVISYSSGSVDITFTP